MVAQVLAIVAELVDATRRYKLIQIFSSVAGVLKHWARTTLAVVRELPQHIAHNL